MQTTDLLNSIEERKSHLEFVAGLVPLLEQLDCSIASGLNDPLTIFLFSWDEFKKARRLFGPALKRQGRRVGEDGSTWVRYAFLDHEYGLTFNVDTAERGTMCRRVQIGVKETPIYEIACN